MNKLVLPLLLISALFTGCANLSGSKNLYRIDHEKVDRTAKLRLLEAEPYLNLNDYTLLSVLAVENVGDPEGEKKEYLVLRYRIEGTQKDTLIKEDLFMGYPKGTIESSWATKIVILDSEGNLVDEDIWLSRQIDPDPLYRKYILPEG